MAGLVALGGTGISGCGRSHRRLANETKMTPSELLKVQALYPVSESVRSLSLDGSPAAASVLPKVSLSPHTQYPKDSEPRRGSIPRAPSYNRETVTAFFATYQIHTPSFEYKFCDSRKWRFDLVWLDSLVALEVQGGIYSQGAHVRGAHMEREWCKLNCAATLGYRILFCSPEQLLTAATARAVKAALLWRP